MRIKDWLSQRAAINPETTALIYQDKIFTYRDLDGLAVEAYSAFKGLGVKKGDIIGVLMPNVPEFIILIHALARVGAVLLPINTRLTQLEIAAILKPVDVEWLFVHDETKDILKGAELDGINIIAWEEIKPGEESSAAHDPETDLNFEDIQGIYFTSGTTGTPKGAMLTFGNIFWSSVGSAMRLDSQNNDKWLICMPLYHIGGLSIVQRCCLYGTTIVLQSKFEPSATLDLIENSVTSMISLVPTMLHRLLPLEGAVPILKKLRVILLGGAAASSALLEDSVRQGLPVAATYGLTETASQVATSLINDIDASNGSVGKPLMLNEVIILNENGESLPTGVIGEIAVRGPVVMSGYYGEDANDPSEHFLTGDLGYINDNGDLWVETRRTDLIVSGGENVYPLEIENVLNGHPEIRESAVVGIKNEEWGQIVVSVVIPNSDQISESDVTEYCRTKLAGFKVPRKTIFKSSLPKTSTGKIRHGKLRMMIEESKIKLANEEYR